MFGSWSSELWRLAIVVIAACLVGWTLGPVGWTVAAAVAALLAWHARQLHKLTEWLRRPKRRQLPDVSGIWADLLYVLQRLQRSNRKRKKKLSAMLGRFYESSAATPDATVVVGAYGEIEWFNESATRLLGLRPRQDTGRRLTLLIRHPAFIHYLARGDYVDSVEFPSPVNEAIQLSAHVVRYGKNQRLITVRDVTRLHRLEVMRRDFIANVSHELRTPLTVVSGYLEALSEDETIAASEETAHNVRQIEEQARRMQRLVDDLLTLSRLETTSISVSEEVPVPDMLADIEAEADVLARAHDNTVACESDATLWLSGNAKELRSAFTNLVSNAIRYSPDGGAIRLRWHADESGAHFEVSDEGLGIDPQHIPRLTERFYRADKDRSRASGGTGLGLAIVKHVLQRHEARLRIDSARGRGSTFFCDFPSARIVRRASKAVAVNE